MPEVGAGSKAKAVFDATNGTLLCEYSTSQPSAFIGQVHDCHSPAGVACHRNTLHGAHMPCMHVPTKHVPALHDAI